MVRDWNGGDQGDITLEEELDLERQDLAREMRRQEELRRLDKNIVPRPIMQREGALVLWCVLVLALLASLVFAP